MYANMTEVIHANAKAGKHFFSPDTMRFFHSRVESGVYGGRYFLTSEQFEGSDHRRGPRCYAIREASPDGDVSSVSGVLAYGTKVKARQAVESILYWLPTYTAQG